MASKDERYSPTPYDDDSRGRSRSRSPVARGSRSRSGSADGKREPRVITSKRLYISNIPYDMKWKDIKDLFKKHVGDCYVSMYETSDGKSRGAGIIEFRDIVKAQEAADKMHRYEIAGRKIVVREETDRDRRRHQNDIRGESGGGSGGGAGLFGSPPFAPMGGVASLMPNPQPGLMGNGNTGSAIANLLANLAPNILQQLGISDVGQITNQVFIANLDYRVTWKKLREVFSLAGNVVRSEIMQDSEGKSRGLAIVQFDTPVEALQAISMFNNQTLFDRTMTVKMDKMAEPVHSKGPLPSGLKSIGTGLNLGPLSGSINSPSGHYQSGSGGSGLLGPGLLNSSVPGGLAGLAMNLNQGLMGDGGSGGYSGGSSGGYGGGSSGGYGGGSGGSYGGGNSGSSYGGGSSGSYGGGAGSGSGYGGGYNSSSGLGNLSDLTSLANLAASLNSNDLSGLTNVLSSLTGGGGGLSGVGGSNLGAGSSSYSSRGGYGDVGDRDMGGGMRRDDRRSSAPSSGSARSSSVTNRSDECMSVFVRNLPFNFTWQMLKEIFKAAGDVQYAEIKRDHDQRSRGCGIVRFANGMEAKRAISLLNNTKVNGRDIEVRLDSQYQTRNY